MRTPFRVLLSFIAGLVVTYAAVTAGGLLYMSASNTVDRDGGMAMAIVFAIGPLAGLIGGIVAAIAIPVWLTRRDTARIERGDPPPQRWPTKRRAAVAAIAWGAAAFFLARLMQWLLLDGRSFDSYGTALAVSFAPHAAALVTAALAVLIVLRGARRTTP